jgi:fatty-acyl-CoA synthase
MIRFPSFSIDAPPPTETLHHTSLTAWVSLQSTYALFEHQARTRPNRPALTQIETGTDDETPRSLNYAQLRAMIAGSANVLLSCGARRGEAVGLLLPNMLEQQVLFWGAQAVATALPLNFLLEPEHLASLLVAADVRVLVAQGPTLGGEIWRKALRVKELLADHLDCLIQVGGTPAPAAKVVHFFNALKNAPDELDAALLPTLDDIAALFHTGGTTGAPKLVRHTHRNELAAAFSFASAAEITSSDIAGNGYPMFHVAGAICLGLATFMAGGHLLSLSSSGFRNPAMVQNHWRLVERYRLTLTGAVATALAAIADVPTGGHDLSSLRVAYSGGSFVPRTVAQRFEAASGVTVREAYGMTESSAVITVELARGTRVLGSAGFAAPFVDVQIRELLADGTVGRPVPHDVAGALVAKGDTITPGYKDSAQNASAFTDDGWLITGDLASMDPTGRVKLLGRSKDVIIRAGHNIDPLIIEEAAASHPDVASAAAIGQPDPYAGELPVCYVVLRPGTHVSADELVAHIAVRVPDPTARPKRVYIIDALPLTGAGKVFKPALRRDAACRIVSSQLVDLPIQRVCAREGAGGALLLMLIAAPGVDMQKLADDLQAQLRGYLFSWELLPHENTP